MILLRTLVVVFGVLNVPASWAQDIEIQTDVFRPFVAAENEQAGPAAELVDLILRDAGAIPNFNYQNYAFGLRRVSAGEQVLSFPWRKTSDREDKVLFSTPFLTLEHEFHYKLPSGAMRDEPDLSQAHVGIVASYVFSGDVADVVKRSEEDDRLTILKDEAQALGALLNGSIDVLPLPSPVVSATLEANFPDEVRLISQLTDGPTESFDLHVVAPRSPWGEDVIERFNESYRRLREADVITDDFVTTSLSRPSRGDIAVLASSEGFPIITGSLKDDPSLEFALPQGTRVLVREWSDNFAEPTDGRSLYQIMTASSLVLVLNGPHIGRELHIQNMHLMLSE